MDCDFVRDGRWMRCSRCQNKMLYVGERKYRARCKASPSVKNVRQIKEPIECSHLLDPTGENVLLFGCGCPSSAKNGVMTAVFECELHERCVPLKKGKSLDDPTVTRCVTCPDNPENGRSP